MHDANTIHIFRKDPIWRFLTADERVALQETWDWVDRPKSFADKARDLAMKPFEKAWEELPPLFRDGIVDTIEGMLKAFRDGAGFTVSEAGSIRGMQMPCGKPVTRLEDIHTLDVRYLDRRANKIIVANAAAAGVAGGVTGVTGIPGLVADLPAIYPILFRAVLNLGYNFGFATDSPIERSLALRIIEGGHCAVRPGRIAILIAVHKVQRLLQRGVGWRRLQGEVFVRCVQKMAARMGAKITKEALAGICFVVGVVVGAFGNYGTAHGIGEAAFHAYRLRFLHRLAIIRAGNQGDATRLRAA